MLALACSPSNSMENGEATAGGGGTPVSVTCNSYCSEQHPAGVQSYGNLYNCLLCGACFDVCTTEISTGICQEGAAETGCSMSSNDCASCMNSSCALQQQVDTTFQGACAAEGDACSKDTNCLTMYNCVVTCNSNGGPPSEGTGGAGGTSGAGGA